MIMIMMIYLMKQFICNYLSVKNLCDILKINRKNKIKGNKVRLSSK